MTASLSKQIKDWVSQTNDWFSYWQLDEALGIAIIILIVALTIYVSFIEPNFENLPIRELDF